MKRMFMVVVCVPLLFFTSCKTKSSSGGSGGSGVVQPTLADASCTAEKALKDIGVATVWAARDDGSVAQAQMDLSGVSGDFRSSFLDGAVYGGEWKVTGEAIQSMEIQSIEGETPLFVCSRSYPKDSIENAALVMASALKETVNKFVQIPGVKQPEAVSMHLFATAFNNGVVVRDNAFYFPRLGSKSGEEPKILVLAHSEVDLKEHQNGVPSWLISGIFSHETGHHLISPYIALGHIKSSQNVMYDTPMKMTSNAFHEAGADLISFYTYDAGTNPLGGMLYGDSTLNRDLRFKETTERGTYKILVPSLGVQYFNGFHLVAAAPDPKDEHHMGAVIAYFMNQFSSKRLGVDPKSSDKLQERYLIFTQWLDAAKKDIPTFYGGGKSKLGALLLLYIQMTGSAPLSNDDCQEIQTDLPWFYSDWRFDKSITCTI